MAIYSDLNEKKITGTLVTDIQAIYQSIYNILNTIPGERLFLPEFGANLEGLLFELINDLTAFSILNEITNAINRWEPRVSIDYSQSSVIPVPAEFKYDAVIAFRIKGLSNQIFQFSVVLTE